MKCERQAGCLGLLGIQLVQPKYYSSLSISNQFIHTSLSHNLQFVQLIDGIFVLQGAFDSSSLNTDPLIIQHKCIRKVYQIFSQGIQCSSDVSQYSSVMNTTEHWRTLQVLYTITLQFTLSITVWMILLHYFVFDVHQAQITLSRDIYTYF